MRFRGGEFSTGTMGNFQPELTTPADEFTTVREPCTRSESGVWRPSSWVLRCFMGFQQWKSRTLRCLPENLLALGRQLSLLYELQSILL